VLDDPGLKSQRGQDIFLLSKTSKPALDPTQPSVKFVPGALSLGIKRWGVRLTTRAVPWLRRLAAGLPPRRPGFDPGLVHVGFVVDKVALGEGFPLVLRFSPVNFIPLVLHY
jgi:hypothetical protein